MRVTLPSEILMQGSRTMDEVPECFRAREAEYLNTTQVLIQRKLDEQGILPQDVIVTPFIFYCPQRKKPGVWEVHSQTRLRGRLKPIETSFRCHLTQVAALKRKRAPIPMKGVRKSA